MKTHYVDDRWYEESKIKVRAQYKKEMQEKELKKNLDRLTKETAADDNT